MTRTVTAVAIALLPLLLLAGGASAHEHRTIGGYQLAVGFLNEPPIVDEPNGLSLTVTQGQGSSAQPVEGLANSLNAEVKAQGQTMALPLQPSTAKPGQYVGNFIPTAEGTYTFHIFGTLNGQTVDETFTSGPNSFDDVSSRAALSFPVKTGTAATIGQAVTGAQHGADTARLLGIAGLVVGALGLAAGGAALLAARRARDAWQAALEVGDASVHR